jgi:hypothetical protein
MKGYSVHIGVNKTAVSGLQPLKKAIANAKALHTKFKEKGFDATLLKNPTVDAFKNKIEEIKGEVGRNDILVVTFNGHGYQWQTDAPEEDGYDEFWAFKDGGLLDDDLRKIWEGFENKKIRIVVISDCCNGGGMYFLTTNKNYVLYPNAGFLILAQTPPVRTMATARRNSQPPASSVNVEAYVLLISIAHPDEPASVDGFASVLIANMDKNPQNYDVFFDSVSKDYKKISQLSTPYIYPPKATQNPNPTFRDKQPFTI